MEVLTLKLDECDKVADVGVKGLAEGLLLDEHQAAGTAPGSY